MNTGRVNIRGKLEVRGSLRGTYTIVDEIPESFHEAQLVSTYDYHEIVGEEDATVDPKAWKLYSATYRYEDEEEVFDELFAIELPLEVPAFRYRPMDEYAADWYGNADPDEIERKQAEGFTEDEIRVLANGWAMDFDELIEQCEEIEHWEIK